MVPALQAGGSQYLTILEQFRAFYLEVIELKKSAIHPPVLPAGTFEVLPPGGYPALIWQKAADIIDRQSQFMIHAGPGAVHVHRETRFVMAALADEIFVREHWDGVHEKWEGAGYWLSHLLEARFFQTHSAGETFFTKVSDLLTRNDPAEDQLARIYLMALALGFRGKYASEKDGAAVLQHLRRRLYDRIRSRNPQARNEAQNLFPEAYLSTISEGVVRYLPRPRRWMAIAAGVVVLWFFVSWGVWEWINRPVDKQLAEIDAITNPKKQTSNPATPAQPRKSPEPTH